VALLKRLRGTAAIVLIEHDLEAVFALADRISVMVYGKVIATGSCDEIRADAAVREAYIGDGEAVL
jgi:branched-chain amino acid transport system ATP-binding protein